jgi:hypothetical protein
MRIDDDFVECICGNRAFGSGQRWQLCCVVDRLHVEAPDPPHTAELSLRPSSTSGAVVVIRKSGYKVIGMPLRFPFEQGTRGHSLGINGCKCRMISKLHFSVRSATSSVVRAVTKS